MRAVAVAVALVLTAPAARADAPVTATFTPIELVFSADETGAGSTALISAISTALDGRGVAASACFAKRKVADANALALVIVDKKGKTTKVAVGGSGDAALDRCLEKAIKPAVWPASASGGAIAVSIINKPVAAAKTTDGALTEVKSGGEAVSLGSTKKTDEAGGTRTSGGAQVSLGAVSGSSATYGETVLKKLRAGAPGFRACYDKALRSDPKLAGRLAITFTIGGDGKVIAASAGTSLSAEVDSCIVKLIKGMTFPSPPDGNAVDITLPFNLAPP